MSESERDVPRSRLRSALVNLLIVMSSVIVLLAAIEGVLRLLGMTDPIVYQTNAVYGYEPKPDQSATRLGVPIFINDIGLRDDESHAALMRSVRRVLVIGDSVTYGGSRIRQADLFTEVLERRLQAQGFPIKVLNAGVNGYSVSQMVNRARRLVQETAPDYLVVYAIRGDFFRPPVQYLADGNYIYPTKRPRSALAELVFLSVHHLDKRYRILDHLPRPLARLWDMPHNYVPSYDQSKVIDIHLAAIEDFLRTAWEGTGRPRGHVLVFFSPETAGLLAVDPQPNTDLIARLDTLNVRAYDLQHDFHTAIIGSRADVGDYYWDQVHYVEKGHGLAADILYQYLVREWLVEG